MAITKQFIGYGDELLLPYSSTEDYRLFQPIGFTQDGIIGGLFDSSILYSRSDQPFLYDPATDQQLPVPIVPETRTVDLHLNEVGAFAGVAVRDGDDLVWFGDGPGPVTQIATGDGWSVAGLNDAGAVVGTRPGEPPSGFLWTAGGGLQALDFGGEETRPGDIANDGTIVGSIIVGGAPSHAFLRRPDGTMVWLAENAHATDIDEHGIVQGYQTDPVTGARRSWVWQAEAGLQYPDSGSLDLAVGGPVVIHNLEDRFDNQLWTPDGGLQDFPGFVDVGTGDPLLGSNGSRPILYHRSFSFRGTDASETITDEGGRGDDTLLGLGGADTLTASVGDDTLDGGAGNDRLDGGEGNDRVRGGAGDDRLISGPGQDTFDGGDGSDYVDYAAASRVHLNLSGTDFTEFGISIGAGRGWDGEMSIPYGYEEHVEDVLISIGLAGGSETGSDVMVGNNSYNRLEGRGGDDRLIGLGSNDDLYGGAGDDLLRGGAGGDLLDGGAGLDSADYADSPRAVLVNLGSTTVSAIGLTAAANRAADGFGTTDRLVGIEGATGSAFGDALFGSAGANVLAGLGGNDVIRAGAGDDVLDGGAGADLLDGGDGSDTASYDSAAAGVVVNLDTTAVTAESGRTVAGRTAWDGGATDTLVSIGLASGGRFDDLLVGNGAFNRLEGRFGDDVLMARGGDDVLVGGRGADELWGGGGGDTFLYLELTDSWDPDRPLQDHIADFNGAEGDRIDLSAIDAMGFVAGNQAFVFIGEDPFSGTVGELRWDAASGSVQGDENGNGEADLVIRVSAAQPITGADFIL